MSPSITSRGGKQQLNALAASGLGIACNAVAPCNTLLVTATGFGVANVGTKRRSSWHKDAFDDKTVVTPSRAPHSSIMATTECGRDYFVNRALCLIFAYEQREVLVHC